MAAEAMKRRTEECPDLETIAEFLDGRLDEGQRAWMAGHLSRCEICYFVFSEAAQMRQTEAGRSDAVVKTESQPARPWWKALPVAYSAGGFLAAAASVALMVATGVLPGRSGEPPELRALVAAVGTDRTVEPRMTGGFSYGRLGGPVRGVEDPKTSPALREAAAQIEKTALGKTTSEANHLLGLAYLTTNDAGHAVQALERAAEQPSADARIFSDLAAAYLARAERTGQQQDLTKALTAADRAIHFNPKLTEALFNRALALEWLSLPQEARGAWAEYLKADDDSGWADEARQHLRTLQ